ncbi:MAG: serine hydrolase [Gemmatimonadaceae bacterium]
MTPLLIGLLVTQVTIGAASPRQRSADDSLTARVHARIAAVPGAAVAIAYRHLGRPDSFYFNADTSFHAASTMKVPVMIELFRRADRQQLSLDQGILVVNQFGSIVDGSPYSLDEGEDSDSALYAQVGKRVPVRDLIEHMITRSSNLATNTVIALARGEEVTRTMRSLGASRIEVRRGVEDDKAYARGLNNTTTARDLAIILAAIRGNRAASSRSCAAMRAILGRQEFNDRIPAGLPPGTRVEHKTGEITATAHDAAIVYPAGGKPYVLVVLTGRIPDGAVARALIADISRLVYAHATGSAGPGRAGTG